MKKSQQEKLKIAKRPREKFVFFYKHKDGWTRFELDNKEQSDAWSSFCRNLSGAPTKVDYETFKDTL